jgi:hypothetical protein
MSVKTCIFKNVIVFGLNRMPETNTVKKICKWKPFTRRSVGRPKF